MSKLVDEPTKYRAFFYLIAYSGLRRSEMLGLEWKDVDFALDLARELVGPERIIVIPDGVGVIAKVSE